MVKGHERFAFGVLNPVKLEPALAIQLPSIGNGVFDGGKFQEIILALARASEQQQYKPYRLHRLSPLHRPRRQIGADPDVNLSFFGSGSKCRVRWTVCIQLNLGKFPATGVQPGTLSDPPLFAGNAASVRPPRGSTIPIISDNCRRAIIQS